MQAHGLGRMRIAQGTIDRWLEHTTASLDQPERFPADDDPAALAVECRVALAEAARLISSQAARICGSRALIGASALDRARRDLDLFLLQHRLDPKIAKLGDRRRSTRRRRERDRRRSSASSVSTRQSPDPWGYRTSDYEQQKYAATLAALPRRSHGLCLEVGCSIGVFTGLLATRCEHVVAIDFSLSAMELARRQPARAPQRRSAARQLPRGNPARLLGSDRLLGDPLLPAAARARRGDRLDQGPAQLRRERARCQLARRRARRAADRR